MRDLYRMYVAGFIISSTMPMSLLETAALVKNLAQNLTFPLLVSANTRSKCKQQPKRDSKHRESEREDNKFEREGAME